jgi:hypothetical protein
VRRRWVPGFCLTAGRTQIENHLHRGTRLRPRHCKSRSAALQLEAPYIGLPSSGPRPRLADRPSAVTMKEAVALGADIGQGRIQAMDDYGIQMQVVSWVSPAQLVPADQAVSLTQAANDRLAEAIRANPATSRMAGSGRRTAWNAHGQSGTHRLNPLASSCGLPAARRTADSAVDCLRPHDDGRSPWRAAWRGIREDTDRIFCACRPHMPIA